MTRKATPKKSKKTKKPAKPKPVTAYIVVREMVSVNRSYTEPDRVFVSKGAARRYAEQLNRELRAFTNPFDDDRDPGWLLSGGEEALVALVKKLGLAVPKVRASERYIDWAAWWNRAYFGTTDAQRDAIWDALDEFGWYKVKQTILEG
jgi:hypothetical protein